VKGKRKRWGEGRTGEPADCAVGSGQSNVCAPLLKPNGRQNLRRKGEPDRGKESNQRDGMDSQKTKPVRAGGGA